MEALKSKIPNENYQAYSMNIMSARSISEAAIPEEEENEDQYQS